MLPRLLQSVRRFGGVPVRTVCEARPFKVMTACVTGAALLGAVSGGLGFTPVSSVAHAATSQGAEQVRVRVTIPEALRAAFAAGTPEGKDKRAVAQLALHQHLVETLLELKPGLEPSAAQAWVKQALKSRFQAYAPSWTVRAQGGGHEAEVTLVVARGLFLVDVEKAQLLGASSSTSTHSTTASSGGGPRGAVLTSLLVDEKSHDIYVLPPEGVGAIGEPLSVESRAASAGGASAAGLTDSASTGGEAQPVAAPVAYHFKPGVPAKPGRVYESDINSQSSPLAERLGVFAQAALARIPANPPMYYNAEWSRRVLDFLSASQPLLSGVGTESARKPSLAWPPPLSMAASSLSQHPGPAFLFVFSVRSADKAGVLEKIDLMRFQEGRFIRTYWSRSLNDPSLQDSAFKAIEKAVSHFNRQLAGASVSLPPVSDSQLRLIVDKKISEREVAAIEDILKGFSPSKDAPLLVPYEVTKSEIRYVTPLQAGRLNKVLERIRGELPAVYARAVPGDGGYLQVIPQAGKKE